MIENLLTIDDQSIAQDWQEKVLKTIKKSFGETDMSPEGILFLMGIHESGLGYQPKLQKEHKQDLIMLGTTHAWYAAGLYIKDEEGLRPAQPFPDLDIEEQEKLLKIAIIRYFESIE
jgi:hypothetical protein